MMEKKYIIRDKLIIKILAFVLAIASSLAFALGALLAIEIEETRAERYEYYTDYFFDRFDGLATDAIYTAYNMSKDKDWTYSDIKYQLEDYEIAELEIYNMTTRSVVLLFTLDTARDGFEYCYYDNIVEAPEIDGISAGDEVRCKVSFAEKFRFAGDMYLREAVVKLSYELRHGVYLLIALSALIFFISVAFLIYSAGYKRGFAGVRAGGYTKIPIDLLLIIDTALLGIILAIAGNVYFLIVFLELMYYLFAYIFAVSMALGFLMTVTSRIRLRCLFKNTLIWMGLRLIWNFIKILPLIWKSVTMISAILFFELLMISFDDYASKLTCWFIVNLILVPILIYSVVCMKKLKQGAEKISEGDTGYTVDTSNMVLDYKEHGETLNSIRDGISAAVLERTKSERMKTELITNVSHDIKTPLTSIINYSDLITREKCDNERINEYSEVLHRQSERLKRLIDDLVEASKASSGNLEVEMAELDLAVLAAQVAGEYGERLEGAGLTLVTKASDEKVKIRADSRRMWRIFDNLFGNAVKYAQCGTRVYLSIEKKDGLAVVSLKNTSRDELDISPDELMERFTRGDKSRSSEGSGLGLSIAKSLCELQGGEIDITVDGDLFKVTLQFDLI